MKARRVIGIVSGKGGVGKTVTAVNLGVLLAREGIKTLLIDSDVQNPSVGLHVGFASMHMGFQDVVGRKIAFDDALIEHSQSGLRILPASLKPSYHVAIQNLKGVLREIDGFEFIVIDSPPSVLEYVQEVIRSCEEVLIVTTPDLPSVTSANKVVMFAEKNGVKVLGVVLNRVRNKAFELPLKEVEVLTNYRVLATIPEDDVVPLSISLQQPLVTRFPDSEVAYKFGELAEEIARTPLRRAPRAGGLLHWLRVAFRSLNPFRFWQ